MQPFQYDLRCPAAKDKNITHAAAAPTNLDAANTHKNVCKTMPAPAVPLRGRSENDPGTTGRVPHRSAGQASPHIIRDTFCPAKHSISCICYLAKTHFVRDFLQIPTVEAVKTLCHPLTLTSLCFDIFWLWHPWTLTSLGFDVSWLWHPIAVTSISSVTQKYDIQTSFGLTIMNHGFPTKGHPQNSHGKNWPSCSRWSSTNAKPNVWWSFAVKCAPGGSTAGRNRRGCWPWWDHDSLWKTMILYEKYGL